MQKTNQENIKEYLRKYEYIAKNLKAIIIDIYNFKLGLNANKFYIS